MKRFILYPILFLLSFVGTFGLLLNLDSVQVQVMEKIACSLEEAFGAHIFFNRKESFVCKNIFFAGKESFCIEEARFSIDPLSLLYGTLYLDQIQITGLEHSFDLNGDLLFSFPYKFSGHFNIDETDVEIEGDLNPGFRAILTASKNNYTLFAETSLDATKLGELTIFLYELEDPVLHLFSKIDLSKKKLDSTFQGTYFSSNEENRFNGALKTDFETILLQTNIQSPYEYLDTISVKIDGSLASAHLEIVSELESSPLKIQGPIKLENRTIKFEDLSLEWSDFNGSMKALVNLDERIIQAKTSLLSTSFKKHAEGHLRFNCDLCTNYDEFYTLQIPQVNLNIDASIATEHWCVKGLKGHLILDEIQGEYLGSLALKCANAEIEDQLFDKVDLTWTISSKDLSPFKFEGIYQKAPFIASGNALIEDEGMKVLFEHFSGKFLGMPFDLEEGAAFTFDGEQGSIDQMHLKFGSSRCSLSYSWNHEMTKAMLDFPSLNLTALHHLFPVIPLKGICHGRLQFEKNDTSIKGSLLGKLKQVEVLDLNYVPIFPLDGDINIRFNDELAEIRCDCVGPSKEEIIIVGTIPLQFDNPVYSCFDEEGPLEMHVGIQGEISPFLKSVLSETTLATGDTDCQIDIKGSIKDPFILGSLSIHNGSYESLVLGCSLQELEADFSLNNHAIICNSITGKDSLGGKLSGKGVMSFSSKLPFDLELVAEESQILYLDYANATASGTIHFKGNRDAGLFEGALTLDTLDIRLPDVTPTSLNAIEVEYVNQSDYEPSPTMFIQSDDPWPILFDISLFFPDHAFVTASSFKSEWRGKIDLKGSTADPLLFGEAKILQGNFLFNGKNFTSNEGKVHFNGSPGRKTSLYLIAKHPIDDLDINVILKGPLREPELAFRSNPPKSSKEILSWILFNKGVGDIDSLQSEELSQNIIKLSDQFAEGPNLLDRFRSSFGIDRIDITSGNDDDMSVRVGKYLTNRLFLSVKKSINDQPYQASIEADLTHNFKAQAEVSDDAEARLMLKWERNY